MRSYIVDDTITEAWLCIIIIKYKVDGCNNMINTRLHGLAKRFYKTLHRAYMYIQDISCPTIVNNKYIVLLREINHNLIVDHTQFAIHTHTI